MLRKYKKTKKKNHWDYREIMDKLQKIEPGSKAEELFIKYECTNKQQIKTIYPELPEYPKDIQKEYLKEKLKWESILNTRMSSKK